jgi:para-aminobenzoate synthetase component 1
MQRIELPYRQDAAGYFRALRDFPWPVWLDSGRRGRYDILCAGPTSTLTTRGAITLVQRGHDRAESGADPLDLLRAELGAQLPATADTPFAGGAVGYWAYDLSRRWIPLPDTAADAERLPDMAVGIYDWALLIDHQRQRAGLVSHLRQPGTADFLAQLAGYLTGTEDAVDAPPALFSTHTPARSNFTRATYQSAFERVQRYLHAGDCYQVNLAQRFSAQYAGDPLCAYLALRGLSPAPYSAFLDLPVARILSASPERFLSVRSGRVETKPIKGTRPRGADAAQDAALAAELARHPKDRAENLMIVDLLRNDLGRCCKPGSVRTPELFRIESYANVHHLVSTIEGELAAGEDALSLLRACFPGGSITGAPKQRAMQIIEELEPHRRGVYCGAIGYIGFDGDMDTNIAIRTLVCSDGEIRGWAGGGIVADSDAGAEYQETLDKASAMLALLERFAR